MRYRKLRIAWSIACGIACLLLIALWVRSYSNDSAWQTPVIQSGNFAFYSTPGLMIGALAPFVEYAPHDNLHVSYYIPYHSIGVARRPGLWGFTADFWSWWNWVIQVPYWFAVAVAAATGTVPWLRWKFSLRTLLILMTVVTVGLGLAVYTLR